MSAAPTTAPVPAPPLRPYVARLLDEARARVEAVREEVRSAREEAGA